jgi:pentapeptide MXKDX repeat protein
LILDWLLTERVLGSNRPGRPLSQNREANARIGQRETDEDVCGPSDSWMSATTSEGITMTKRFLLSAAIAGGLVLASAAFAQDAMKKDGMAKDTMSKTDKMDKMDKKDGMKKTDGMTGYSGGDKMKKDEMKK